MRILLCIVGLAALVAGGVFLWNGWHFPRLGENYFCFDCALGRKCFCCRGGRSPSASLKTLAVAQNDFRVNDRDENGIQDFWRKDVAGLYTVKNNKLIELSVAAADSRPVENIEAYGVRGPTQGYWLHAIPHAGEKTPDPDRFAYCCFPASYPSSGKWTYILDERHTMYRRDLGRPGGIEVFPDDAELAAHWSKMD